MSSAERVCSGRGVLLRALVLSAALVAPAAAVEPIESAALNERIELLFAEIANKVADAPLITAAALVEKIAAHTQLILLDERSAQERLVSTIPGAIPLADLSAAIARAKAERANAPVDVVVFCTIGYRSGQRAARLNQADTQVRARNLRGGILAWIANGGALVTPNGKATKSVHVYSSHWAAVPTGYLAEY